MLLRGGGGLIGGQGDEGNNIAVENFYDNCKKLVSEFPFQKPLENGTWDGGEFSSDDDEDDDDDDDDDGSGSDYSSDDELNTSQGERILFGFAFSAA